MDPVLCLRQKAIDRQHVVSYRFRQRQMIPDQVLDPMEPGMMIVMMVVIVFVTVFVLMAVCLWWLATGDWCLMVGMRMFMRRIP